MDFVTHFRDRVGEVGDTRSLTFLPDGRRSSRLGFADLDRRARAAAVWLESLGMRDQPVLLLYPPGLDFMVGFLGCLYGGVLAIPAPLPQAGPHHLERALNLIRDSGAKLILTDAELESQLAERFPHLPVRCVDLDVDPDDWAPPGRPPDEIAYVQYTSGSTSEPRGVQVTHAGLLHNIGMIDALAGRGTPRRIAGWIPHYHDMGLVGMLLHALYSAADLVYTTPPTFVARPARWLEMISRYRADWTAAPNFGYSWAARMVTDEEIAGLDLSCLAMALNGAEPVRAETLAAFERRFGPAGFDPAAWAPGYGMAETTLLVTGVRRGAGATIRSFDPAALERHEAVAAPHGLPLVASGRTVDLELTIVDPRSSRELPEGMVGEIQVAGDSVAAGYRGRPEETRRTFGAGDGSRLRTGDLGFLLDGELFVTGRLKEVIIVNGRNLYPQDLEELAIRAHGASGQAAAFGVSEPGGEEHVVVVQELGPPGAVPAADIAEQIAGTVGRAFGVVVSVVLVGRGGVQVTTSGKVRRRHMRNLFLNGDLEPVHQDLVPAVAGLVEARV